MNMELAQSPLYAGIDGGGSKTTAVISDSALRILGEADAGPSNHLRVGIEVAAKNVEDALYEALRHAGVNGDQIAWTYCGIAGSEHPDHRKTVVGALEHLFPAGNFTVDSDARIALTAGVGFGRGVALIAGTGSVAFGRNDDGREARAGGWGPTIGDEGSGYWIAIQGLSAVARALDGRGPDTSMVQLLCTHYGMCDAADLPYFVYAGTTHADDIARYSTLVIEAAREGDARAKEIFEHAGRELARIAAAVATRLDLGPQPFTVACSGGAFAAAELLIDPLRAELLTLFPKAELIAAPETPPIGAIRMAMNAAQHPRADRG